MTFFFFACLFCFVFKIYKGLGAGIDYFVLTKGVNFALKLRFTLKAEMKALKLLMREGNIRFVLVLFLTFFTHARARTSITHKTICLNI